MDHWHDLLRTNMGSLDVATQQIIYHSFRELVYRDIYYLCGDHLFTEDVIHESFMKILSIHSKLEKLTNPQAWIRRVTRNTAFDLMKKNRKYHCILDAEDVHSHLHPSYFLYDESLVSNEIEVKIRNEVLLQSLQELKQDYRQVLYLYYIQDKSYKQIAVELNLSTSVITQRLARARKKLQQEFMKKWDTCNG